MIHSIDTLTVKRYIQFDESGKLKYFKKSWNFLPIILFKKQIQKLDQDLKEFIFDGNDREDLNKENLKTYSYNKLLKLNLLYEGLYNLLVARVHNNLLLKNIGKNPNRNPGNLKEYIIRVENLTGIRIKEIKDLNRLKLEIQRMESKYMEHFKEKESENQEKGITFIQLVLGVFSILGMPYNENISMKTFGSIKNLAERRAKELKSYNLQHGSNH